MGMMSPSALTVLHLGLVTGRAGVAGSGQGAAAVAVGGQAVAVGTGAGAV